jgi:hypothetical protein
MRTFARPIEIITITDSYGNTSPLRFKTKDRIEEDIIIKVDKVEAKEVEKLAGDIVLLYKCRGFVNDKNREFELKYELVSCKWMLWRM